MQEYVIRKAMDGDREQVVDIFNHFVQNGFAAYPERKADYQLFDFLKGICREGIFYVIERGGKLAGFGLLRHHQRSDAFNRSSELTYFILPEHQRMGLGTRLLKVLAADAAGLGVETLLANISSLNEQSLKFHRKQGFKECGRFVRVGSKFGRDFNVIWMQKFISRG